MNRLNQLHSRCLAAAFAAQLVATAFGQSTYVNFEGKQTNPVRLSPDGTRLFAVNTPDARLSVFDVSNPSNPVLIAEIPVGIEPVSVNPRSNEEAWVVNEVSDSVSIVSVSRGVVTHTLQAKDEPCDVVFAAGRAFVTCSRNNQVRVFDPTTHAELAAIPVAGLNPRALAVSPNGTKIYAAFALSGNRTTIIPHALAPPQPSPVNITNAPPEVSLIVDATDTNWSHVIQYTMPDNDVVEIDAMSLAVTRYFSRIGTVNLGLAVHPVSGDLFVANTDARNLVRFEPTVRGHVVHNRVSRVAAVDGTVTAFDLNLGIDYGALPNPSALATALAQPTALTFDVSGNSLYVAAFGTDRIARLDTNGTVLSRIEVGPAAGATVSPRTKRGPRGLALTPSGEHLYVLNRIANTLAVIDTSTETILRELPLGSYDPTPVAIRSGRGFLYDAKLSGNGTVSCASCHVDAEMDMLAWDLGNPGGQMQNMVVATGPFTTGPTQAHPMKGPMTTQTLRGLKGTEPLHWRGDRASFLDFNPAFASLMGGETLSSEDMQAYKTFIETIVFAPNPHRNVDNSLPQTLGAGDPRAGESFFRSTPFSIPVLGVSVRCVDCHSHATGVEARSNFRVGGAASPLDILQPTKIPQLRSLYQKLHFDNTPGAESLAGFGFEHDGIKAGLAQAHTGPRFAGIENNGTVIKNLTAFLLCFDTGAAPAVGYSRTITASNVNDPAITNDWNILENQPTANCGLVVKGTFHGARHGFLFNRVTRRYETDQSGFGPFTRAELVAGLQPGDALAIMGVPPTSGRRMGIDRNANGVLDGDEMPPRLAATRSGADIVISWPTNSVGVVLEFSESLLPPDWKIETSVQSVDADRRTVTVPTASQNRFYRLRGL